MIHWLLNLFFERRDVVIDGELYLRRWYLWQNKPKYSGAIFLHCFLKSDAGSYLHDHPWSFRTIGLRGRYVEELPWEVPGAFPNPPNGYCQAGWGRLMRPLRTWKVEAKHRHRVHVVDGPVWTLVFAGPAKRVWGFWVDGKWVDWRTHMGLPPNTPDWLEDKIA